MHQRWRLLAALACGQATRANDSILTLTFWRCACLHGAPCSGRHPMTDPHQLALGPCPGGSTRCPCTNGGACLRRWRVGKPHVQPIPSLPSHIGGVACLHGAPCSGRHPMTDPHQLALGPCPGGSTRCPCTNGGACLRRWRVGKPHVRFHPYTPHVALPLAVLHACMERLAQGVIR